MPSIHSKLRWFITSSMISPRGQPFIGTAQQDCRRLPRIRA
jgi:hypothetical protein